MRGFFTWGVVIVWLSVSVGQEAVVQAEPISASFSNPEPGGPAIQRDKTTTSLAKMEVAVNEQSRKYQRLLALDRDWVGDVKESNGDITRIRLELGQIRKGKIYLVSLSPGGEPEIESPMMISAIPGDDEIRKFQSVEQMDRFFGPGHKGIEEWHGPNGILGTKSWVCTARNKSGGLDFIRIVADIFYAEEEVAHLNEVIISEISRGTFRKAKTGSGMENLVYPSGKKAYFAQGG